MKRHAFPFMLCLVLLTPSAVFAKHRHKKKRPKTSAVQIEPLSVPTRPNRVGTAEAEPAAVPADAETTETETAESPAIAADSETAGEDTTAEEEPAAAPKRNKKEGKAAEKRSKPEPAVPVEWPERHAYLALENGLGRRAIDTLAARNALILHESASKEPLLLYIPEMLDSFASDAARLAAAAEQIEEFEKSQEVPGDGADLAALEASASGKLITPALKAAAAMVSEARYHRAALGKAGAGGKPLYKTAWGGAFARLTHAEILEDPGSAVSAFFDGWLSGPSRSSEARTHVEDYLKEAYGKNVGALLDEDAKAGKLSEELKAWLAKYLADQRRLHRLSELPLQLAALARDAKLDRDISDLRAAAAAFVRSPGLLQQVGSVWSKAAAPPETVKVTATDLHLADGPTDKAVVTAAYWVDGLKPGESLPIQETGFVDSGPGGVSFIKTGSSSRRNGGPYPYSVEIPLADAAPLAFRLVLSGRALKPVAKEITVAAGAALDKTLKNLSRADDALSACKLKEAADAYGALEKDISGKRDEPQLRELLDDVRRRRAGVKTDQETSAQLDAILPIARLDADPEQCDYRTDRADKAVALLRKLPAGCGLAALAEINSLRTAAERRRLDQRTFDASLAAARAAEKACRFPEAVERYGSALAVLNADKEARCGPWQGAYDLVRDNGLPDALSGSLLRADIQKRLAEAKKDTKSANPRAALELAAPLLAQIDALPSAVCYADERKEAESLASAAGSALAPPGNKELASLLPADPIEATIAEVRAEKRKREKQEEALATRQAEEQAPPQERSSAAQDEPQIEAEPAADEPLSKKLKTKHPRPSPP